MHILVVDDDQAVRDSLKRSLQYSGYEVASASDGVEALAHLSTHRADAVIMDVMMPRLDGLEATRALRTAGHDVPILVLTARDLLSERIQGLDSGADDFLVKPFAPEELAARLRAVTRRMTGSAQRKAFGAVEVDLPAKAVWLHGQPVELTAREWAIWEALVLRAGRIVSKSDLEALVCGFDSDLASNALEVHVFKLRSKLGKHAIETIRGLGYRVPAPE